MTIYGYRLAQKQCETHQSWPRARTISESIVSNLSVSHVMYEYASYIVNLSTSLWRARLPDVGCYVE